MRSSEVASLAGGCARELHVYWHVHGGLVIANLTERAGAADPVNIGVDAETRARWTVHGSYYV